MERRERKRIVGKMREEKRAVGKEGGGKGGAGGMR